MRRLLLLAAGLVTATACAPTRVPVEVDWTFGGKSCADAGVATIQIDMAGELLDPTRFACDQAGTGVHLGAFLRGSHTFALAAHGSNGAYYAVDNVAISVAAGADTAVSVNVPVATPSSASAEVRWTFASGKTCADVGVDHIYVYFDPPASGSWGKSIADTACAGIGGPVTELQNLDVPHRQHTLAGQAAGGTQPPYRQHPPK